MLMPMSPAPSPVAGPCPSRDGELSLEELAAAAMARNGSRLMMNDDESSVNQSPRPAPISSSSVSAIPSLTALGAVVRSTSWATTGATASAGAAANSATARRRIGMTMVFPFSTARPADGASPRR